jgi:hypothetical protein
MRRSLGRYRFCFGAKAKEFRGHIQGWELGHIGCTSMSGPFLFSCYKWERNKLYQQLPPLPFYGLYNAEIFWTSGPVITADSPGILCTLVKTSLLILWECRWAEHTIAPYLCHSIFMQSYLFLYLSSIDNVKVILIPRWDGLRVCRMHTDTENKVVNQADVECPFSLWITLSWSFPFWCIDGILGDNVFEISGSNM